MKQEIKERIKKIQNGIVPEGYKKTKVGIIPKDWEVKKLFSIADLVAGATPSTNKSEYWNGSIPWMSSGEINNKIIESTEKHITELGYKESSTKIIPENSILIAIAGQGKTRGKVAINKIKLTTNQSLIAIYNLKDLYYLYLLYYLDLNYLILRHMSTGAAGRRSLTMEIIKNINVPVFPLKEQQRIAYILETWDRAIELKEKYIQEKQTQKKGLIKQLLQPRENWIKIKLKDLGSTYTGLSGKTKEDFGQGKKFITYKNIFDNSEVDLEIYNRVNIEVGENQNEVKYGDVFFTTSSETPHEVGMSSVLLTHSEDTYYLNSFCFGYRLNNFETVLPQFLKFYLRSEEFRRKIFSLAQGSTRFNLSKNELMKLKIEAPPITEQQHIAKILSTADREIELLNEEVELLKQQKKGLMQLLLTGIIRVKGDDDGSNDIR